ncbi:hypothetical protein Pcinc_003459 [Petrolisthes cinctipes]|uniref:Uncharacterized protein n=1 Tax=Petrolisthes cinctipes TaxID=88211 RepID=A0AAE1GIW5_PETCI|nr:hypothetical protein Pcinc_003459 [Petrolisthes cinctipes]
MKQFRIRDNETGMFDPKASSQGSRKPCIITHLGLVQLYRLCTFQILIENQLVRRLAEKGYSAGIEGYWYQYFKRVFSMKEMIIHQKWYKMLFLMHKKMPKVMHMKHNRVCSTKEMIIHQKWY